MTNFDFIKLLTETEAMLEGHFELSSGFHSNQYFQCAKLLQYPDKAEIVAKKIAEQFNAEEIDIVVGPALGGVVIAYEVGRALKKRAIFAERKDSELLIRRGFEIKENEKVLIIEDVITTAKSAIETANLVKSLGGNVIGYGCIVDRSNGESGLEIKSIVKIAPELFNQKNCPMCQQNIKINKPGSRPKPILA
ncbi:MAG: orotate phosphoribosyltransferase [bacterium]